MLVSLALSSRNLKTFRMARGGNPSPAELENIRKRWIRLLINSIEWHFRHFLQPEVERLALVLSTAFRTTCLFRENTAQRCLAVLVASAF